METTQHTPRASAPAPTRPVVATDTGTLDATPRDARALVAAGELPNAGRLVWWRLHGDVGRAEFLDFWADLGGNPDLAPPAPTPAAALRHTLDEVGAKYNALPRPIGDGRWALILERRAGETAPKTRRLKWQTAEAPKGRKGAPRAAGVSGASTPEADLGASSETPEADVAVETDGAARPSARPPAPVEIADPGKPLDHQTLAVVHLERGEDGQLSPYVTTLTPAVGDLIRERFAYYQDALTTREVATWLPKAVRDLDGVSLRDRGGFYFIPPAATETWATLVTALRGTSGHRVSVIPVMAAEDTAVAVLDALQEEASAFVEETVHEVTSLGAGAVATRRATIAALQQRLTRYEALFGEGRLAAVRGNLAHLDGTLETIKALAPAGQTPAP